MTFCVGKYLARGRSPVQGILLNGKEISLYHEVNSELEQAGESTWSRYISVGIATGYGLDGRGSIPGRDKKCISSPKRPEWLWGSPSPLFNGYR
jgi:hypothetical protein